MTKPKFKTIDEELRHAKRVQRELRNYLRAVTVSVDVAIVKLDMEMKGPSNVERGRRVSVILNALDLVNDQARHFGLNEKLPLKRYGVKP